MTGPVIIVVLAHFDQKGLPDWPLSITLNSFLAFFTTLIKATFMLPVSTAISQMKWSWFLQDRPIYDFHIIDQASRGLLGSFMLLWRAHLKNFISLGAVIVITSTLTSPVTQLAINYPMRDRRVSSGAYARAIRKIETPFDALIHATSKAIQLAIASDNSLFNNPMPPLEAFCSTGNCTFDKYHTLGVCVKMANISSDLKVETFKDLESAEIPPSDLELLGKIIQIPGMKIWKASLSDHFYAIHLDGMSLYTDILVGNETFGFRNDMNLLRMRIASFALIFTTPVYNDTFSAADDFISESGFVQRPDIFWHEAWEVLFHLCVQSYDTKVQAGADETQMVSSIAIPMEPEDTPFMDINCPQSLYNPSDMCEENSERHNETLVLQGPEEDSPRPNSKPEAFSANYFSIELAALRLRQNMASWVVTKYEDSDFSKPVVLSMTTSDFIGSLWSDVLFHPEKLLDHNARNNSLHNIYLNVATALSSV
ncbi:hypothetical protein LCI18_008113 [Fusarium solani-melongenae]|uniref:Uncharacterized protein n=1 Tax=Fusarium solani subsp. cucurbitae TaxID=2747967 RepID=A0ACD3Z7E7_FUSSC|nr:hypothetical protein LCI18_008113 [Fusarium solani-melongenae]